MLAMREMNDEDLEHCDALFKNANHFSRIHEIGDMLRLRQTAPTEYNTPFVVECFDPSNREASRRIVAFATGFTYYGLALGELEEDIQFLLLRSNLIHTATPLRLFLFLELYPELFRWCLAKGLKVVKNCSLMVKGEYQCPKSSGFCYIPSIVY